MPGKLSDGDLMALLDVYMNEFSHRDNILWSQVYRFFYATLVVIVLPNVSNYLNINVPPVSSSIFRIIGLIMSAAFLYVSLSAGKRLEASTATYRKTLDMLPEEYRRVNIKELRLGKLFTIRTSYVIIVLLFLALIAIDVMFMLIGA